MTVLATVAASIFYECYIGYRNIHLLPNSKNRLKIGKVFLPQRNNPIVLAVSGLDAEKTAP
jgi:hypothetical protein